MLKFMIELYFKCELQLFDAANLQRLLHRYFYEFEDRYWPAASLLHIFLFVFLYFFCHITYLAYFVYSYVLMVIIFIVITIIDYS